MEPEMYDGTVHPEVWLNKVKYNCYQNNITTDENILNCCKTLIHPSINNVAETKSFAELINVLKSHISFESFKNSVKRKLTELKFDINNKNEILKLLNNFQQYCYEAEIKEFGEQKKLFLNTLSVYSIHHKFIYDNLKKVNSMKELMKYFDQSLLLGKQIKYGSCVALKHVATGKYLSSCDVNYRTGSEGQVVFAGQNFLVPDAIWIISKNEELDELPSKSQESVSYREPFYLFHKALEESLDIDKIYESPVTKCAEVSISEGDNQLKSNQLCKR